MGDQLRRARVTPLMVFCGVFAAAGAVVPWYFNPLAGSITSDFLIGTISVLVWMVVEARRLGMQHGWFYVVATFLVAFAFACPLLLFMREARLAAPETRGGEP